MPTLYPRVVFNGQRSYALPFASANTLAQLDSRDGVYTYRYDGPRDLVVGDALVVDSPSSGYTVVHVVGVSSEAPTHRGFSGALCKPVVAYVDDQDYVQRQARALEAAKVKAAMDRRLKALSEEQRYAALENDSEGAELLRRFRELHLTPAAPE